MEEQEAIAMKQTLGVDDKQWKIIEPKLRRSGTIESKLS